MDGASGVVRRWASRPDPLQGRLAARARAARARAARARAQWRQDTAKRGALREHGWNVIVITGDSITRTPRATVEEVRRALRAAGAPV